MTRRIALAILATVWTLLIVAGVAAYAATRSVLIADLDAALCARATAQVATAAGLPAVTASPDDRWLLRDAAGRTLARPTPADPAALPPPRLSILSARFTSLDSGLRERSLILQPDPDTRAAYPDLPDKIFWSAPATALDHVLARLAMTLTIAALLTGLAAAAIASAVARRSLAPLHSAAASLGQVDERHLDRRIDQSALPVELRPVAAQLNTMLARLQDAFASRKQFLADASHELRTPVAALLTTLEVALRRPRAAEELTTTLNACLTDARLLRRLVDSLLTQARADNPNRHDQPQDTDLTALLTECATVAAGLAADRDVTVTTRIPDNLRLTTHPHRLRSIVTNLLSNAIDYNNSGGSVTLTARLSPTPPSKPVSEPSEDPDPSSPNPEPRTLNPSSSTSDLCPLTSLLIEISDTGPGIPASALPHIFQPFFRASPAATSRTDHDHLGLGLFLVQTHAQALGGRVDVSSQPGTGTRFTVTLPTHAPDTTPAPADPLIPISLPAPYLVPSGLQSGGPTS